LFLGSNPEVLLVVNAISNKEKSGRRIRT